MWREADNKLIREFRFSNFQEAFTFMTRVAFIAERLNHRPSWYNSGNYVRIELFTYESGNTITDNDRNFAEAVNEILK